MMNVLVTLVSTLLLAFWAFYFGMLLPVLISSKDTLLVIFGLLSLVFVVILPVVVIGRYILKEIKGS